MNFLQTKPQIRNMNIYCFDLYYTVLKSTDDKEHVDNKNENDENDLINLNDIIPNLYIARKYNNQLLR